MDGVRPSGSPNLVIYVTQTKLTETGVNQPSAALKITSVTTGNRPVI